MKSIILILMLFISGYFYGQEVPIPVPPSMQEFLKYAEVPVSEYTGVPNISIPIYTVSIDGFQLPLKLTYHSSGNRVSDEASWVGLGWDLQLGSVMQIINDEDDFKDIVKRQPDFQSTAPLENYYPYRFKYGTLSNTVDGPYWTPTTPLTTPSAANGYMIATGYYLPVKGNFDKQESRMLGEGFVDSEPDVFIAQFLGHSIKFVMDFKTGSQAKTLKILNEKGYKIKINDIIDSSVPDTIPLFNFEIIAPDGITYYFEQKSGYMSQGSTRVYDDILSPNKARLGGGTSQPHSRKQWYLSKIKTINNRIITINYLEKGNVFSSTFSQTWRKSKEQYTTYGVGLYGTKILPNLIDIVSFTEMSTTMQKRFYISSIKFPNGEISFDTSSRLDSDNSEKLDKIAIYNKANLIKEFTLNYDYFKANTSGVANNIFSSDNATTNEKSLRLKLMSFQENGKNPYTFKYNNINLPYKNSFSIDYWGYYNGHHTNKSLIPNPSRLKRVDLGNNGNNHSANITYAKAGILEEITYPTNGRSLFEYELNEFDNYWLPNYYDISNTIVKGLGLRIKSVTNEGIGGNVLTKKEYRYYGGKSLQRKVFFKSYYPTFWNPSVESAKHYSIQQISSDGNYSSSLLNPVSGIGYDSVEVENLDVNNSLKNGYRVTTFANNPEEFSVVHARFSSLPGLTSRKHYANGSVLSQQYKNSGGDIIKKEDFNYHIQLSPLLYGAKISLYGLILFRAINFNIDGATYRPLPQHLVSFYPLYADKTILKSVKTTNYFDSGNVVTLTERQYDNNNSLTSEKFKSNGVTLEEKRYTYTNNSLIRKNRLTTPTTITRYSNGKVDYLKRFLYKSEKDLVLLDKVKKEYSSDVSSQRNIIEYVKYDNSYGLPLEVIDDKNKHIVYLWGYNYTRIVAKIENVTYGKVMTALGRSTSDDLSYLQNYSTAQLLTEVNKIRCHSSMQNTMVTTYTHKPLVGVTSITDPKGYTVYYEYDEFNRLQYVKDATGKLVSESKYHYKND